MIVFFMAFANLTQLVYQKIMCFMIVSRYKMHIDITNQFDNHSDNLIKPAKTETKNILIDEKNFKKW